MDKLQDADWWWDVAPSGFGVAIIVGLVAWVVRRRERRRTSERMRDERALAKQQALENECRRLVERTRVVRDRVLARHHNAQTDWWNVFNDLMTLCRQCWADYRSFARLVYTATCAVDMSGTSSPDHGLLLDDFEAAIVPLQYIEVLLGEWIVDPRHFEDMPEPLVAHREEAIKHLGEMPP